MRRQVCSRDGAIRLLLATVLYILPVTGDEKAWEPQDALHNPIPSNTRGFRLPDTIKIERVVGEGEQRVFAEVVPD